jgi:hypothetical protein
VRFEKDQSFLEIVLEGARVHVAKGSRALTDADVRTYVFGGSEAEARESFDDRVAEARAKGFAAVGEDTPIVTSYLAKRDADRAQTDAAELLAHGTRGKSHERVMAEAQAILGRWHAALGKLDDVTAGSLGKVYGDRITQLEELIRGG